MQCYVSGRGTMTPTSMVLDIANEVMTRTLNFDYDELVSLAFSVSRLSSLSCLFGTTTQTCP